MSIRRWLRRWFGHRRTQRLIDENRRLLAERDRLIVALRDTGSGDRDTGVDAQDRTPVR